MNPQRRWLAAVLPAILLVMAAAALAGDGEIRDGKVNLSVMYGYRESDPDAWRPLFEEASRLLWNATNGQLQLGRIRVVDCGFDKERADIWILDDHSGAFANLLGLGGAGHIYLSQTHKNTTGGALGQFGLVHEFGHYGFGVYDEYKGVSMPGLLASQSPEQTEPRTPHQYCTTEGDSLACIMDGGSTIVPNNLRTEYCTGALGDLRTRHNSGVEVDGTRYVNAQEAWNGESCWETIARQAGLNPPAVVDPETPPGLQPIDWQIVPGLNRLVIAIDRSVSMAGRPDGLALAREAARLLVALLHARATVNIDGEEVTQPGDNLGIVSFDFEQTIEFPLRELTGESSRDSALARVDSVFTIRPRILSTDIGGGLQASLDQIAAQGSVPACNEAIVLFSDGKQNTGTDPRQVIPALRERGARVYSVAIGAEPDTELMKEIADSTGGLFFLAPSAEELPDAIATLAADIRSAGTLVSLQDSIFGQDEHLPIFADGFAEEVTVNLEWDLGTLDMVMTSPSGDQIDLDSADDRQDVEAGREGNFLYIRVLRPEPGAWDVRLIPVEQNGPTHYGLTVLDESRTVTVKAETDREVYDYPAPIHLRVSVSAGVPVAGAQVTAEVVRPGGDVVPVELFDDGRPEHDDRWARDGVYNVIFGDYTGDGMYTFHVRAVNENGTGPDPTLPFVEDGPGPPLSIPPFTREAEVTVQVQGMGAVLDGTLEFHPESLNAKNHHGRVTAYLELPEPFRVQDIDIASIRLNSVVPPLADPINIDDHNGNGVEDLMLKFDRGPVLDVLPNGMAAVVRISGDLTGGEHFVARDTIRVFDPSDDPVTVSPDTLAVGAPAEISWPASDRGPVTYAGFLSMDGGDSWHRAFEGVSGTSLAWDVTGPATSAGMLLVQAESPEGVVVQALSRSFVITEGPTGVGSAPLRTRFLGVSPNPSGGASTIRYTLGAETEVDVMIHDVSGRLVLHLAPGRQSAGTHGLVWNGKDGQGRRLPSGVYQVVFRAGRVRETGRVMMIQ